MPPKKRKIQSNAASMVQKRKSRLVEAAKKRKQRLKKHWFDVLESFTSMSSSLENQKGKVRTYDENRMAILAINASLRRAVEALHRGDIDTIKVVWTAFFCFVILTLR